MTGIPIYNVNNNCSTGSTALYLAKQLIENGNVECMLALGFEKMEMGSLKPRVCGFHIIIETLLVLTNIDSVLCFLSIPTELIRLIIT